MAGGGRTRGHVTTVIGDSTTSALCQGRPSTMQPLESEEDEK